MLGRKTQISGDYTALRRAATEELGKKSSIAAAVARVFAWAEEMSRGSYVKGAHGTDRYLRNWLLVAIAIGVVNFWLYPRIPWFLVGLTWLVSGIRILDITQAVVNLGLFAHLGSTAKDQTLTVIDVTRSLVLLVWNFGELILWFGLLYSTLHFAQGSGRAFWDSFYFSGVTQLTIGYGDLSPVGIAKLISIIQGVLSWLVTVVVLARFVTALPKVQSAPSVAEPTANSKSEQRLRPPD